MPFTDEEVNALNAQESAYPLEFFKNFAISLCYFSIQKAKQLLNYSPSYSIQEGLEEAIEWYWNNLLK